MPTSGKSNAGKGRTVRNSIDIFIDQDETGSAAVSNHQRRNQTARAARTAEDNVNAIARSTQEP